MITESINPKITHKIWESNFPQNVKDFLIFAIRQEYEHSEQDHWHYTDVYDKEIKRQALK